MSLKLQIGEFRRENDRISLGNWRFEKVDENVSRNKKGGGFLRGKGSESTSPLEMILEKMNLKGYSFPNW